MMSSHKATVKEASWNDDKATLRAIRTAVFVEEQNVPIELEWDDEDKTAIHLLALTADGEAAGTARLLPSGQIGRMAVLEHFRDQHIGEILLNAALQLSIEKGLPPAFLHAQIQVRDFYSKAGFEPEGDIFMEAGIAHVTMRLPAAKSGY